jgi:nitrogen-specific signal transduction histidine kinase
LQRDLDPSVGMVDVYPQEITRVLLNLISNGFCVTTKRKAEVGDGFEPMLSAATRNLGDKVEIRIRDNGTGIPDEVREKIFIPHLLVSGLPGIKSTADRSLKSSFEAPPMAALERIAAQL